MGTLIQNADPRTGRKTVANSIIIKRDAKLPVSVTQRYYTVFENQVGLDCSVTQSEGAEDNREFVNVIHEEVLSLPPNSPAKQPVDITYSYDVSGKIHCLFTDVDSGNKHEIELRADSTKELDESKKVVDKIIIE